MSKRIQRVYRPVGGTSDATAKQWDIKTGKTAYIAGGKVTGTAFTPGMMLYDGNISYNDTFTCTGNTHTFLCRFKLGGTSTLTRSLVTLWPNSNNYSPLWLIVLASTDANHPNKLGLYGRNNAGTTICTVFSNTTVTDGGFYSVLASYNSSVGRANLWVNGVDDENTGATGRILTTGTMQTGTMWFNAGGIRDATGADKLANGDLMGYVGFREGVEYEGSLHWSVFFESDGQPKYYSGAHTWNYWNYHGYMFDNWGTDGDCAYDGTGSIVPGGADSFG